MAHVQCLASTRSSLHPLKAQVQCLANTRSSPIQGSGSVSGKHLFKPLRPHFGMAQVQCPASTRSSLSVLSSLPRLKFSVWQALVQAAPSQGSSSVSGKHLFKPPSPFSLSRLTFKCLAKHSFKPSPF
ncbi:hypothetical protein EJ05DRAFT_370807 [Pseudovirgaria hyperparasitica]|uniref:Uncharacterized protein n=1 Tax=Pseudovirgaria hyperparasitica TaxID=470096 RepID=A0A6A6W783_9PEZI|nr:uncharacterized protein EJ05DRAFT_370807 [Pseudovirgaria hyperparasitica]KAF2757884.1 hypothetical protein EJ05DRAFT_370807 [Pseudovirgaria hyperparasitica]